MKSDFWIVMSSPGGRFESRSSWTRAIRMFSEGPVRDRQMSAARQVLLSLPDGGVGKVRRVAFASLVIREFVIAIKGESSG